MRERNAADASSIATSPSTSLPPAAPPDPASRVPLHPLPSPPSSSLADGTRSLREGPASRRKPAPSPLQQQSSPPYHQGPRSPREKLDALIAEETHSPTHPPTPSAPSPPHPHPHPQPRGTQPAKPSSYAQLRNPSAPLVSLAGASPPASPTAMPPPSRPNRPNRPETRPTVPRNASMDSGSSLSSQDTGSANPPDMASLVAAAGSAEAVLLAMWKEKQSAANHNTQLWRLVEKQRSMILGLQKDLERALKDKDRYRKKFKEYANQAPPLPGAPQRSDTFDSVVERDDSESPAPSEKPDDPVKTAPASKAADHRASPLMQESSAPQLLPDAQLAHSPSHSSEAHTSSNAASSHNSPSDYSVKPLSVSGRGLGLNAIVNETAADLNPQTQPPDTDKTPQGSSSEGQLKAPELSLTQATPVIGGDGFEAAPAKPAHPLRKAPPAPLNLSKPAKTSAHLHHATQGERDDSDYDDTLEVDEIPIIERGRRKTREEDDRVREALAMREEEARSKSLKKKKSETKIKAKSAPQESDENGQTEDNAAPLSPRQFNATQAGLPLSPRHPPPHSLNALLSPTNSESSTMAQRSVGSPPLMSPGLPNSPRPGDRPLGSPMPRNPKQLLASPPMSPRSGAGGAAQPAARTPRQPVPLPPNTPQSYQSPQVNRVEPAAQPKQQTLSSDLLKPPNSQPSPESESGPQSSSDPSSPDIYRGLVSEQYPTFLLPPNALPSIKVQVFSSRLRPSRLSLLAPKPQEEDPVFILAIYARSDNKQLWRMEKTIMALPTLDAQLKSLCDFHGKVPDRALFGGHAPAKMDARRAALNHYFDAILETPMNEQAASIVCEFFSTDVIGAQNGDALTPETSTTPAATVPKGRHRKEGYLTKRGKNFGGWKARYFILDGPEFRYYEAAGGAHLGTIKLQSAQIGKQSQQQSNSSPQRRDDSEDNQYRHAFLILEPKRKDSSSLVRHVLCAESDDERDAWVDALLQHVDWQEETSPVESHSQSSARPAVLTKSQGNDSSRSRRRESPEHEKQDRLQTLNYDDTIAAEAPIRGPTHREARDARDIPSPKSSSFSYDNPAHHPSISGPSNGAPIQNAESWGNRTLAAPTTVKDKKRSIFGFRGRGSSDLPPGQLGGQQQHQQALERIIQQSRNIFGVPLQEAVESSQAAGLKVPLPSVVYRCLEYLKAKKAANEEGIFRLSGSSNLIKALRERFNNEGDVKLLDGQYYDVHAVASLLKLFLRELPSSILTRELHLDFLKVLDMDERAKKIQSFNVLVHKLPRVNFELLRHISSYLIEIIDNAAMNKMTVRNVGIVFAPTLNIPAPLISFFLTDFMDIYGSPIDEANSPIHEIHVSTPPLEDEAVRSPRRQMFSDIPTPAFNETSFSQQHDRPPSSFPLGLSAPSHAPPQPPKHPQSQYAGYDTGFIPIRPTYDAPLYEQHYQGDGYGSLNGAIQSGSAKEQRQKRRESGMLLMNMNMGQRKGSNSSNNSASRMQDQTRANPLMVQEETAFD